MAVLRDGSTIQKWNEDGSQNRLSAHEVAEFHLMAAPSAREQGLRNFSLFLTKDQRLIYRMRRHSDSVSGSDPVEDPSSVIHIVGYEEDQDSGHFSAYCMLMPDGRIEWSHDLNHITKYERNLDVHPLRFYEE